MGTPALVAKKDREGAFHIIGVNWDGYPSGVGATLLEHYSDVAKLDRLISLGDVSSLGSEIGEYHPFDERGKYPDGDPRHNWTTFYHRDRKEPWYRLKPRVRKSLKGVAAQIGLYGAYYVYLFDESVHGGTWLYTQRQDWRDKTTPIEWLPLTAEAVQEPAAWKNA